MFPRKRGLAASSGTRVSRYIRETMATSLVRGKYVICKVTGRREAQVIEDGAVFQRDGVIVDVGAERRRMHRTTVEGTRPF